jgi:hypothetical protein
MVWTKNHKNNTTKITKKKLPGSSRITSFVFVSGFNGKGIEVRQPSKEPLIKTNKILTTSKINNL